MRDKIKEPIDLLMSGQMYNSFEKAINRMISKSVEVALIRSAPNQSIPGTGVRTR